MPEQREAWITPAQDKVLHQLMHDGATDAEIAVRMFLSVNTVKTHMKRILAATGSANRTALAIDLLQERVIVYVDRDEWS